jgi:hypothetical protein
METVMTDPRKNTRDVYPPTGPEVSKGARASIPCAAQIASTPKITDRLRVIRRRRYAACAAMLT